METADYKALCLELFGTVDVAELKKIAQKVKKKNERNAGRKKKFTDKDIRDMKAKLQAGESINAIAEHYGTSRQIVSKYLTLPPAPGYTMRIEYMYRRSPCTIIDVDFLRERVKIENRTDDVLRRAFGVNEHPTWADFETFLRERCVPEGRGYLKDILRSLEVPGYDPLQIAEKTRGKTAEDEMWMKFQYYDRGDAANENRKT